MTIEARLGQSVQFATPESSRTGGHLCAAIITRTLQAGHVDLTVFPPGKAPYCEAFVPHKTVADSPRHWSEAQ